MLFSFEYIGCILHDEHDIHTEYLNQEAVEVVVDRHLLSYLRLWYIFSYGYIMNRYEP